MGHYHRIGKSTRLGSRGRFCVTFVLRGPQPWSMMSYSIDNDKQLVQKGMLDIYCTMSDYELDRENKVLFPTYLVNMKN